MIAFREPAPPEDSRIDPAKAPALRLRGVEIDPAALAAWLVPAVLILFLSLENGGYDLISRSQVGIAIWWLILIGTLVGFLPIAWRGFPAGLLVALLAAFAAWTALSLAWTSSDERTVVEAGRIATYLGVFILALAIRARGYGRQMLNGVTTSVAVVVALAVFARLEPNLFPQQDIPTFLPENAQELQSRLAYPLNYSTGLAVLGAVAIPLLLTAATGGRNAIGRYLAVAALPVVALALWLTGSGLALPLLIITVIVYLVLTAERVRVLATILLAGLGGFMLIMAAESRAALDSGLPTPDALREGDELLVILLVVCSVVAVGHALLEGAFRRWPRLGMPPLSPRSTRIVIGVGAVIVVGLVAAGAGGVSDRWDDFRSAEGVGPGEGRADQALDVSARGRYQYWQSAIDAYETEPVLGLGPGTFEFWWAREGVGEAAIFTREAHSLYLETLAELGPLGLLLVAAFVAIVLARGARSAWSASSTARPALAAAVSSCLAFAAAAAVDWVWELGVIPVVFLFLAAVAIGPAHEGQSQGPRGLNLALAVGLSLAALIPIGIPLAAAVSIEESREAAEQGRPEEALREAREAVAIEPFAASPRLQEAAVLETLGRLQEAIYAAREATEEEAVNWRTWLLLSRLEARAGNAEEAAEAFDRAQSLFPRLIEG